MFKNLFGGNQDSKQEEKPPTLPDHLQMGIDLAKNMKSLVGLLVLENEPVGKVQEEMEPLHRELVNLLNACIEVDKENEKRHFQELDSSKFVLEQVQSQLIVSKKELNNATITLNQTKQQLQEAEKISNSQDMKLMHSKQESLQQKLDNRQERIDNLQNQLDLKDREYETELARVKARFMLKAAPASDNERIQELQAELEETRDELDQVREENEQMTEDLIAAEDKLKEADDAIQKCDLLEDKLEQLTESHNVLIKQKNAELENMGTEKETAHIMVEEFKNILNEQAQELQEKEIVIDNLSKEGDEPLVDQTIVEELKDELATMLDQLQDKEILIKNLREDFNKTQEELQNMKEIVEIQSQVLQDQKKAAPQPPASASSDDESDYESDDESDGGIKISLKEHEQIVYEINQRLEDAHDKINYQTKQLKEQHQKMNTVLNSSTHRPSRMIGSPMEGAPPMSPSSISSHRRSTRIGSIMGSPMRADADKLLRLEQKVEKWKARALEVEGAPNPSESNYLRIGELEHQVSNSRERNHKLETQIEEAENNLEEALQEIESQAAELQENISIIRSLERVETTLEGEGDHIRDDLQSTNSSLEDELDEKERLIENLEVQLLEANAEIQRLEGERGKSFASNTSRREERESFISSLELQLDDADNAVVRMEVRLRDQNLKILSLEEELDEARQASNRDDSTHDDDNDKDAEITELRSELEKLQERAMSEEEYAELQKALVNANKSMKKGQKQITKLTEQIETKDREIQRVVKKIEGAEASLAMTQEEVDLQAQELEKVRNEMKSIQQEAHGEAREELDQTNAEIMSLREESESKDHEINDLEQRVSTAQNQIRSQAEELERLRGELDAGQSNDLPTIEQLRTSLKEKEEAAHEMDNTIHSLREMLEHKQSEPSDHVGMKSAEESLKSQESSHSKFGQGAESKTYQELKEEVETLQQAMDEKDLQLVALRAELDSTKAVLATDAKHDDSSMQSRDDQHLKEALQEKEPDNIALREELDTAKVTIEKLEVRISENIGKGETGTLKVAEHLLQEKQDELQSLKELLKEKDTLVQWLQNERDQQGTIVTELESSIQEHRDQMKSLQEQLMESRRKVTTLESALELPKQVNQRQVETAESLEEKLNEKVASQHSKDFGQSESDLLELKSKLADLEATLKKKQEETVAQKAELSKLREAKSSPESAPNQEEEEEDAIRSLEKDIGFQEKDDMIKSLQREIDELSSGGRERKNHEIVVDETSEKRQVSLEKLKAEHQEGDENIESLRDQISRLQTQVETLERDLRSTVKDRDRKWMEKDTEIESLKQKLEESENNAKQTNDAEIKSLKQKLEESENNAKQTNDAEVEQLKQELERSKKSTTQTKRKSIKVKQDKEAEIDALNETIQDLEAKLRKGQQSRKQVSGLKAKLDREMEQSAALVREKQAEIDILTADLQLANSRIGELGEKLRNDRERLSRKASKDDQRVSDLKDRLNEEMGHSESLKKQMETYKASLKAKRNIIDSQAYELRDSQDKLDTQESADRKTKRRMQQLEKEIWKMENELENVNSKIRSWRQMKHRHNNGGRDARGLYGDSIDNIPVTQYLDQFSKKVVNARRQLEAAQERMNRAG